MQISLGSSLMAHAQSMEGKSLEGYSRLSPFVLQSKRMRNNEVSNNTDAATSVTCKSDKTEEDSTNRAEYNQKANAKKTTVSIGGEVFFDNSLSKTSSNKSYVIDGVAFSSEEVDAIRGVLQNAVSPLSKGQVYYDYKEYAAMGIAESTVAEYAKENLTEEQADIVNKCLSDYIGNLLDKQNEWINSECHYDNTEGVGDTGEMNTYYGVRHNIPQQYLDKMRDFVLNNKNLPQDARDTLLANISATGRTGGIIYCATNKELAGNIRSLFSGIDVTDADQLSEAFKQYKSMMNAAYKAIGFGNTTNNMLNNDTSIFTKQVSNMKAVFSGINRNGVDRMV